MLIRHVAGLSFLFSLHVQHSEPGTETFRTRNGKLLMFIFLHVRI